MLLFNRRPSLPKRSVTKWHRAMLARWAYDAMDRVSYFSKNEELAKEANRYLEQRSWKEMPRSVLIDWADREFAYRKRKSGIPEEDDTTSLGRQYDDEQLNFRSMAGFDSFSSDESSEPKEGLGEQTLSSDSSGDKPELENEDWELHSEDDEEDEEENEDDEEDSKADCMGVERDAFLKSACFGG